MRNDEIKNFATKLKSGSCVCVKIISADGSTPRDAGTIMLVDETRILGTIGGGQLEFMSIDHARSLLSGSGVSNQLDIPLGPEINQCCGGFVKLSFEVLDAGKIASLNDEVNQQQSLLPHVCLFGAGHVGRALVQSLSQLPLHVTIVETRRSELESLPDYIQTVLTPIPEAEIAKIKSGGAAVALTHDHALDFEIMKTALMRDDLGYVGMIGSRTKRTVFVKSFLAEGRPLDNVDRLVCPIGQSTLNDKRPEVIAAMVTAEIARAVL